MVKNLDGYAAKSLILIIVLVSFIAYFYPGSVNITGFIIGDGNVEGYYSDNINLTADSSSQYSFNFSNYCDNCTIKSFKISGYTLSENGGINVELISSNHTYLVLNESLGGNLYFNESCIDSCELNVTEENYTLNFTIDPNATIFIENIYYYITNEQINFTDANITINESYNVTEAQNDSWVLWNDSREFDGEIYYEMIENSGEINLSTKYLKIDINAFIGQDSKGVLVSKYSYLTGERLEVGVNPEGAIRFYIGNKDVLYSIETNESFNDNKFRNILVLVENGEVSLYVDGLLYVKQNLESEININNTETIAVGANIGYINYMNQSLDNYKGTIRDIKIYY